MKKVTLKVLITIVLVIIVFFFLLRRKEYIDSDVIQFGTDPSIPPMTFVDKAGELTGFEVNLAKIIAGKLGKKYGFKLIDRDSLDGFLANGMIDAYFAAKSFFPADDDLLKPSEKFISMRWKYAQVSIAYHGDSMAFLFRKSLPIRNLDQLHFIKKIVYTHSLPKETLLQEKVPWAILIPMDTDCIKTVEAGITDCAYVDINLAKTYCEGNTTIGFKSHSDFGYWDPHFYDNGGVRMIFNKKRCPGMRDKVNQILKDLESSGELSALKLKWGLDDNWKLHDDPLGTQE